MYEESGTIEVYEFDVRTLKEVSIMLLRRKYVILFAILTVCFAILLCLVGVLTSKTMAYADESSTADEDTSLIYWGINVESVDKKEYKLVLDNKEVNVNSEMKGSIPANSKETPWLGEDDENGPQFVSVEILGEIKPYSTAKWFKGFSNITDLDLSNLNSENVIDMSEMFFDCQKLKSLDLSNLNTSNVTNMSGTFYGCQSLRSLDLSNFDTSNVTDMSGIFIMCYSLISLDISKFDTGNVTNMSEMFYACESLVALDLSNFDTSNVTDMSGMFNGCENLFYLTLSESKSDKVENMARMFEDCRNIVYLNLASLDMRNVTNMECMFKRCLKLTSIDMSNCFKNGATPLDISLAFDNCSAMWYINLSGMEVLPDISEDILRDCDKLQKIVMPNISAPEDKIKLPSVFWNGSDYVMEATSEDSGKTLLRHEEHDIDGKAEEVASCTYEGYDEYYFCTICDKYFTDETATCEIVDKDSIIRPPLGHIEDKFDIYEQPTCTHKGVKFIYCSRCGGRLAIEDIDMTEHSLVHVEAKEATNESVGNIEYWYCSVCKKCFADGNGENEINLSSLEIPRKKLPNVGWIIFLIMQIVAVVVAIAEFTVYLKTHKDKAKYR